MHLQPADQSAVSHSENATNVSVSTDGQILNQFHPAEAFRRNLRGYISTVLPALKCRMDVQTSDGKGMLLRYTASYVY